MSKRNEFIKRTNLKENLKKYNAFSVYGYYPLFNDVQTAEIVSPLTSYHIHEFEGVEYYMPEGLEMGKTQFHGDYLNPQPKLGVVETISTEVIIYIVYGGGGSSSALDTGTEQSSAFNIFRFYPDTQTHVPMSGPLLGSDNDIAAAGNFIYQYDVVANKKWRYFSYLRLSW